MIRHTHDQHKEINEKKLRELEVKNERLDQEIDDFLKDNNLSLSKIESFNNNQNNFTSDNWAQLQAEKTKLDEKLKRDLSVISDPREKAKKQKQRHINPKWLFVR